MRFLLSPAAIGSLIAAALSTLADYFWHLGLPPRYVSSGVIQCAVIAGALGVYLGWRKGQSLTGLGGGVGIGVLTGLSYYGLAATVGAWSVLVCWLVFWVLLSSLQRYLDWRLVPSAALFRGVAAALASSLGFGVVLFRFYRGWPAETFQVFTHATAWILAFWAGLAVVLRR